MDSCIIVPTETPYDYNTIKRALLTYDKVQLFSPNDRDFIPPKSYLNVFSQWSGGVSFPVNIPVGSILPLGKVENYDYSFERLLDDFASAVKQGALEVLSTTGKQNDFTIGFEALPEEHPNPFLYIVPLEI